jgi:hypothetical protein
LANEETQQPKPPEDPTEDTLGTFRQIELIDGL